MNKGNKKEKLPKAWKKLKPFFDEKKDAPRRLRAISTFLTDGAEEEETGRFMRGQQAQVHATLMECFAGYEASCKKGKHDLKELQSMVLVLRALITHLHDAIADGWQTRSLLNVIEKLLYKENKPEVRASGFQLLLLMCETLGTVEADVLELIPAAVNFNCFADASENDDTARFRTIEAPEKSDVLVPAAGDDGGLEESVGLVNLLFDFMSSLQSGARFAYWYEQFKVRFLYIFYPHLSPESAAPPAGFRSHCPHAFQDALVDRLAHWTRHPEKCGVLLGSQENMTILWHLYTHGVHSSVEFETIRKFIHVYKGLCWPHGAPLEELRPKLLEYRKCFVEGLLPVFEKDGSVDNPVEFEGLVSVCKEVLSFFRHSVDKTAHEPELQEVLMRNLLHMVRQLCSRTDASHLVGRLCGTAVDTVLYCWVRSNVGEALWKSLQLGLSGLFSGPRGLEVITHTRDKLVELTLLMRPLLYPEARKNAAKKKRHNHAESEADPLSPDDTKPLSLASEASREITLAVAAGQQEASGLLLTVETIIPLWHHVLNIFAGVNAMKSPELQAAGIGVVTSVADMLLLAETEAPHAALTDPSRPRPLELLDVFGPWLFAACQLSEAFVVGKALAYGTLCRLVCRRTEAAPGSWLLGHFYRLLRDGLVARTDMRCAYAILLNSSLLFALALDGASVLIPHYLATIRHLIVDASACTPPPDEDIKQRALSLVCSLVSVGSHLDGLDIVTRNSAPYMVAQARSEVADILRRALAREKSDELKAMCVWGLCVLLFDELHRPQPEQAAVLQWLEDLLHALASPDSSYPVLQAVVDALSSLSLVLDRLAALGQSVTSLVVTSLASHALDQIAAIGQGRAKPSAEGSVVREVECVVDWVMAAAGAHVLQVLVSDAGLMQHIHALLEAGVAGAHGSAPIRDATEAALYKLVNHAGNFPPRSGIAVLTSQLSETDDQPPGAAAPDLAKQLFFLYNQSSLVSLVQPPPSATHLLRPATDTQPREGEGEGEGEKSWGAARVARVMVRDATGKYAWDAVPAYAPAAATAAFRRPSLAPPTDGPRATQESTGAATPAPVSPAAAPEGTAAAADKLHGLLQYLSESFAECEREDGKALSEPAGPREGLGSIYDDVAAQLEAQISSEAIHTPADRPSLSAASVPSRPKHAAAVGPGSFQSARLLLSHLGYLLPTGVVDEDVDGARFTLLENTDKFRRSVSQLDKSAERELQKIGVIYVKRGQEDQNTILRNDKASRSPLFSEFIHALGWTVPVANHLGYTGGLDRLNRTTGEYTPYYANHALEVIFHDITSMPTEDTDEQQILKKRHVGNDIVHIVYSEHARDYHPVTITSQFNDAHVVVYPLPDGLFRVQVFRKPGVGLFGPLIDGMVVRKELVGQLVRQTAMNANRYVRYSTQGYEPPYPTRRRYLNDLAHRFSLDPDPPALLAEVVYPTPDRAYLHPPAASSPLPTASPSDSSPATSSSAITIAAASGVTPS